MAVRKQHLVSQVVLRRFADANGQVLKIDLERGKIVPRHPAACMWESDFISAAPDEAEALWKTVEDRMHDALTALDNDTLDQDPQAVATVKDCIALHFIRSHTIKWVTETSSKGAVAQMLDKLLGADRRQLEWEYYKDTHIHLAGREGREFAAKRIMATIEPALSSPKEFWERVRDHFQSVKEWCAPLELEILSPRDGTHEFLIGDTPALSYEAGNLMGGPKAGVTLNNAAAVYMPLGPRHVVSLARTGGRHTFEGWQVAQVNEMQVRNAHKEVCSRIDSGLIAWHVASYSN